MDINNIINCLNANPNLSFFELQEFKENATQEILDVINTYYENNKKSIITNLFTDSLNYSCRFTYSISGIANVNGTYDDKYNESLVRLFDSLLKSEECNFTDIEFIEGGTTSSVCSIGNKILKFGTPREIFLIPNHEMILQPLIRFQIPNRYDKPFACIEVQEKVETFDEDTDPEATQDNLYKIYIKLRQSHIIWTDIGYKNLGKLLKPNHVYLGNKKIIPSSEESRGFMPSAKPFTILNPPEWVVIDTDFLFKDTDPIVYKYMENSPIANQFEERYQLELKSIEKE